MANLRAVMTVARVSTLVASMRVRSSGTSASGCTSANLPRHSATTLRVPSSELSQCVKRSGNNCGSTGCRCAMPAADDDEREIISRSEPTSRYWRCALVEMLSRITGRKRPMLPTANLPSACDAADLISSCAESNAARITCSTSPCSERSVRRPISPMHCSEKSSSCAWRRFWMKRRTVASRCDASACTHVTAMHCAIDDSDWRESFLAARPSSASNKNSKPKSRWLRLTAMAKSANSDSSVKPCSNWLSSNPSALSNTSLLMSAADAGLASKTATTSCNAKCAK